MASLYVAKGVKRTEDKGCRTVDPRRENCDIRLFSGRTTCKSRCLGIGESGRVVVFMLTIVCFCIIQVLRFLHMKIFSLLFPPPHPPLSYSSPSPSFPPLSSPNLSSPSFPFLLGHTGAVLRTSSWLCTHESLGIESWSVPLPPLFRFHGDISDHELLKDLFQSIVI